MEANVVAREVSRQDDGDDADIITNLEFEIGVLRGKWQESTDPGSLKRYLESSGWKVKPFNDLLWLAEKDGDAIGIPNGRTSIYHGRHVQNAMRVLCWIEQRDIVDMAREIETS